MSGGAEAPQLQPHRFWLQPLVTRKVLVRPRTRTDIKYSKEKHPLRRNKKNFLTVSKHELQTREYKYIIKYKCTRIVAHDGLYVTIFIFAVINEDECGLFRNKYSFGYPRATISTLEDQGGDGGATCDEQSSVPAGLAARSLQPHEAHLQLPLVGLRPREHAAVAGFLHHDGSLRVPAGPCGSLIPDTKQR